MDIWDTPKFNSCIFSSYDEGTGSELILLFLLEILSRATFLSIGEGTMSKLFLSTFICKNCISEGDSLVVLDNLGGEGQVICAEEGDRLWDMASLREGRLEERIST
jgi:hypothetical protein